MALMTRRGMLHMRLQASADTAAHPVVAKWAAAVKERAVAEQTLLLLETHAAAIAVGLS